MADTREMANPDEWTDEEGEEGRAGQRAREPVASPADRDHEVIRIEDLAPRDHVTGGRKIVLGEIIPRPDALLE